MSSSAPTSASTTPEVKTVDNSTRAYVARALGVKKAIPAYRFYVKSRRAAFKEENPSLDAKKITSELAKEWRNLDEEERKPHDDLADEDKERFTTELEAAIEEHGDGPLPEIVAPVKRVKKEKRLTISKLYGVKGAKNAYIFFGNQVRPKIVKKHPNASPKEILSLISEEWKTASASAKKKCEKKAVTDKTRYTDELKAAILANPDKLSQLPEKTCARYQKMFIDNENEEENTAINNDD